MGGYNVGGTMHEPDDYSPYDDGHDGEHYLKDGAFECAMHFYIFYVELIVHTITLMRQFGIRLEQRELIGVLNTIPLNSLRFVVEETICTKCSDEVHQEIVDRPVSGVYKVSFVL